MLEQRKSLTNRQKLVYDILKEFQGKNNKAPTFKEVKYIIEKREKQTLKSLNSVRQYFNALEQKGAIDIVPKKIIPKKVYPRQILLNWEK